jgi:diguanylate cyclase (GGDEF)-like protein
MKTASPPTLTALEAREQLSKELEKAWNRGSAESSPLALMVVAFDKPGTAVGLGIMERALRVHCARTHDVYVRRAHDEYVVLLPSTPPAGARHVGEQLVEAMRAEGGDYTHRVSVGVAVAVPDEQRTPADLLRRAESALQAARIAGGDRIAGGAAASTAATTPAKGALAQLRDLLPGKKKNADLKRRTD